VYSGASPENRSVNGYTTRSGFAPLWRGVRGVVIVQGSRQATALDILWPATPASVGNSIGTVKLIRADVFSASVHVPCRLRALPPGWRHKRLP